MYLCSLCVCVLVRAVMCRFEKTPCGCLFTLDIMLHLHLCECFKMFQVEVHVANPL